MGSYKFREKPGHVKYGLTKRHRKKYRTREAEDQREIEKVLGEMSSKCPEKSRKNA